MRVVTSRPTGAGRRSPRRPSSPEELALLAEVCGKITALQAQQKDPTRRSVYVDGRFCIGLHEEVIILVGLKVGQVVDGTRLLEAVRRDEAKRAWDDSLRFLSIMDRSCKEIERKLVRRYPPEVVCGVLERLAAGNWLDDAAFARRYCNARSHFGANRLLQELKRKGVALELANRAVTDAHSDIDPTDQAHALAAKRLSTMSGLDRETAQRRLMSFLARRGYDFETSARALSPLLSELPRAPRPEGRSGLKRHARPVRDEEEST